MQRKLKLELLGVVGGALGTVGEDEVVTDARVRTQELLEAEAARIARDGLVVTTRVASGNPVAHLTRSKPIASGKSSSP